jgi:8-oxo-dGTP diphosphatase
MNNFTKKSIRTKLTTIESIAYYAVIEKSDVKGSDDAAQARWFPIDSIPPLAFDHDKILRMALEEIKKGMI